MKKYIDADIFVTHCCNSCIKNGVSCCPTVDSCDYIEDLQAFLVDAPAADVSEVVRCGECDRRIKSADLTNTVLRGWLHKITMNKDDFCSYGAKMEDKS